MEKIWPSKSTTVRALVEPFARLLTEASAHWVRYQFTRPAPRAVPVLGRLDRPHRSWRMSAEGNELMVYAWGDPQSPTPLALLAHGWNGNAFQLFPLVERLRARGMTVVAFDQPAHGRSSGRHTSFPQFARNLESVAARLPRLDLFVGHSMGGAAGGLALARGMAAREAVLVAPPADLRDWMARLPLTSATRARLQTLLEHQEKVELARLVPEVLAPKLRLPGLVVVDRHDREVGFEASRRWAEHWPLARLVVTEGRGHNRILEEPDYLDGLLSLRQGFAR